MLDLEDMCTVDDDLVIDFELHKTNIVDHEEASIEKKKCRQLMNLMNAIAPALLVEPIRENL